MAFLNHSSRSRSHVSDRGFDSALGTPNGLVLGAPHEEQMTDGELESTRENLLEEIERLAEELGDTPTSAEMNEEGAFWGSQYYEEFGSWNNALREARFEPNQRKIPTDELLGELRRLARDLGRTPTKQQLNDRGEYWGKSYLNRFGSWNDAIRQAGLEPNQRIAEADFREPPDTCKLCGEPPEEELDFHHWRYGENKAGCYLCRECHDDVHASGARPEHSPDWLMQAVENLIQAHATYSREISAAAIADHYNIPSQDLVEVVLSDTNV